MLPLLQLAKNFRVLAKNQGIIFAMQHYLGYLGYRHYSIIEYPNGMKAIVRTNNFWRKISEEGWENHTIRYLQVTIQQGQTVIDVGGYLGSYTILMSMLVGESGQVHTFEPDPIAFPLLQDNIQKNKLENIFLNELALSEENGKISLISRNFFGHSGSSIADIRKGNNYVEALVNTVTLDDYCKAHSIKPDLIKIDVEGGEFKVLNGAKKTINTYAPKIILEYHNNYLSKDDSLELWTYLISESKEIKYLGGEGNVYTYNEELRNLPEEDIFRISITF